MSTAFLVIVLTGAAYIYAAASRMSKVKQKVCGCYPEAEFAQPYCRTSSYLQTLANQACTHLVSSQRLSPVSAPVAVFSCH